MSFDLSKQSDAGATDHEKPAATLPRRASSYSFLDAQSTKADKSHGHESFKTLLRTKSSFCFPKASMPYLAGSLSIFDRYESSEYLQLTALGDHTRPTLRYTRAGDKSAPPILTHPTDMLANAGSTSLVNGASGLVSLPPNAGAVSVMSIRMSEDMLYQLDRLENPDDSEALMVKQLQETFRVRRKMRRSLITQHPGILLFIIFFVLMLAGIVLYFMLNPNSPAEDIVEENQAN